MWQFFDFIIDKCDVGNVAAGIAFFAFAVFKAAYHSGFIHPNHCDDVLYAPSSLVYNQSRDKEGLSIKAERCCQTHLEG